MSDQSEIMNILAEQLETVVAPPLAVIGVVQAIEPVPGADFIVLATLDCGCSGTWMGVVQKSVVPGLRMAVFLQDAILPPDERWAFMSKHKWRVRMARFKGAPSECVAIELPCLDQSPAGEDLTQALGVTKYSKPLPKEMAGVAKGNFPSFIPKTDEPNFQRVRDLNQLMNSAPWYVTDKADGTSCTAYIQDEELHVCSRNLELVDGDSLYWRMAREYGLTSMSEGVAIQFEIVGPGVQGNPMGLKKNEIRVFTGYFFEGLTTRRMTYDELVTICAFGQLPMAQFITKGAGALTPDELRKMADIQYANGKTGEGIVIRATDSSWSFKVLNLAYVA